MRMCHFRAKFVLVQTIIITFSYLLVLFTVQNFKKFLQWIHSYEDVPFWTQNGPFAPNKFFFLKFEKFLKNSSSGSSVMRMHNFWAQNGPFLQMIIFSENLLISLVSFIHAYLHAKNQSQILIY